MKILKKSKAKKSFTELKKQALSNAHSAKVKGGGPANNIDLLDWS